MHAATGIWAKYGDSIPLDGLAESINETANVGTVTGNLADALNWAGINEDDFQFQVVSVWKHTGAAVVDREHTGTGIWHSCGFLSGK